MGERLTAARVAVVSGKGGVGKTTVATALAMAAARAGRNVLLAEIEDREAFAPIFGLREIAFTEERLAPNLTGISVQADEALVEYLSMFYGIPKLSRALVRSKAVEFATNTAPGLRDILLIGKIKEAERRRREGAYAYDLIVLDAPPTGRLPRFLDAPRAIAELVRGGPIRTQAQGVLDMVLDPKRLQVVLVTHPEDMPVRETADAAETLQKMGIALGPVIVNGVWPAVEELGDDPSRTLRDEASASGLHLGGEAIGALVEVATAQARRVRNQRDAIDELAREVSLPRIELPSMFTERIGLDEIRTLEDRLAGSGLL